MTDNIYLFCDMNFNNRMSLEKYLDPLLARLPEEKRKILAPNGVKDASRDYVRSHSIFCRFKKTCSCPKVKAYPAAQFILSDRRPVQPYTLEITEYLDYEKKYGRGLDAKLMDMHAWYYELDWGAGCSLGAKGPDRFQPIWRQVWDTVTVTEHEHSESGATLWQPIGNGMYEWAHVNMWGDLRTGLGRIAWDNANATLFRVT